ncbi:MULTISPECIES: PqqD family protein [Streptomyces]|uniref:PqqD family protein n=1 Tax=Streptomyces TaxID=1883 RepID=UPI0033E3078B
MPANALDVSEHKTTELRRRVLTGLRSVLSEEDLAGAARCATRLHASLPARSQSSKNVVLVAYGGGKDSSYTLAFVRAMQLLLWEEHGETFRIRVATNRHAGMPRAVMENMDRAYRALDLPDDPACEMFLVDGNRIRPFDVNEPQNPDVISRNQLDILMTGHRTAADGRPTFCNACNLSMANSFGLAAGFDGGVDLIITGDSQREQRDYYLWVARLARRFGLQPPRSEQSGFKTFLGSLNRISQAYFADIHGAGNTQALAERVVTDNVREGLQFFSIYDDTAYASGSHWKLLTEFLGFSFDDVAFSFTESDCGNPALMAHLRALKWERRYGRTYAEGLDEYVEFAVSLMHQKEFPPVLVEIMRRRYAGESAAGRMRAAMDSYAMEAYGFTEEHLVAMVYAPFTEKGAALEQYIDAEQPDLGGQLSTLHGLLSGEIDGLFQHREQTLVDRLERMTGLTLAQLRILYGSSLRLPSLTPVDGQLIDAILEGDPHKRVVHSRRGLDGQTVPEMMSGR